MSLGIVSSVLLPLGAEVWREASEIGKESYDGPDFLVRQFAIPGSHSRVTDSVLHDPKQLPVGFGRGLETELRHARIKRGRAPVTGLGGVTVAPGAGIAVNFHSGAQVVAGRNDGIGCPMGLARDGVVKRLAGDDLLPARRVGSGGDWPESGECGEDGSEWKEKCAEEKSDEKFAHWCTW